jgi:hypothetical protein
MSMIVRKRFSSEEDDAKLRARIHKAASAARASAMLKRSDQSVRARAQSRRAFVFQPYASFGRVLQVVTAPDRYLGSPCRRTWRYLSRLNDPTDHSVDLW